VIDKNGIEHDIHWQNIFIKDEKKNLLGVISSGEDLSAIKKIQESMAMGQEILENIRDCVFIYEPNGKIIYVNKSAAANRGYSVKELLKMNIKKLYPADQKTGLDEKIKKILAGNTLTFEGTHIKKSGAILPLEIIAHPFDLNGKRCILSIGRDISIRKGMEDQLRNQIRLNELIINSLPLFFVAIDQNSRLLTINQEMLLATGYKLNEVINKDYLECFVPAAERDNLRKVFSKLINEKRPTLNENSIMTKSGQKILVEWNGSSVVDEQNKFRYLIELGTDITSRKQSEQAAARHLEEIEKLNQIMIDREQKMIELKRENEQLRKNLAATSK
jgi:PAS domain S-box-containing protein